MQKWVRPYLLDEYGRFIDQLGGDGELKKALMERFVKRLEDDEIVFWELSRKVNSHFSDFVFAGKGLYLAAVFGAVLADLPKKVFMRLVEIRNVRYTLTLKSRSEVDTFIVDVKEDDTQLGSEIVVSFPFQVVSMPILALVGTVAHQLAHVYLQSGDVASNDVVQYEADRVAQEWGFCEEIAAMRKYNEQYELEKQQQTTHGSALLTQEQQYPTNNDEPESSNVGK